ncbi:multidrug transporter [Renibacterium salmoninarum ATCC 33209]|uniref:Multidrug transporter n=1 Tax=Renibacterium salmoninarum (strain ATCC 33209 / DSM 20767 / JCM 11484 / NBRC 15589 / NCIMB 2235) TaxID=288705 RepID=A9WUP9_RENSM|nr:multidrug transporter [Renibacterium salmoninarum ATCC 33209]
MSLTMNTRTRSVATLMVALLTACIAFQLNASMLSPALLSMGQELHTDQSVIGLTQTSFFNRGCGIFTLSCPD